MPRKPARGAAKGEKSRGDPPEAHLCAALARGRFLLGPRDSSAPSPRGQLVSTASRSATRRATEAHVLNNVSLTVRPGELVAVIGGSGSGKSTLLKLALRFYDRRARSPSTAGTSQHLPEDELRGKVTWLPQEPPLFPVTLRENIAYGAGDDVPFEVIMDAAKAANCHGFIKALPEGYQTKVAASGGSLSAASGSASRARGRCATRRCCMLDEPTSALDPTSAELVEVGDAPRAKGLAVEADRDDRPDILPRDRLTVAQDPAREKGRKVL